jgi:hypothetical protein
MVVVRFESSRVCALGSWMIGANMQCKLFVALQLEVVHHFIERCAGGSTRRFKPPATVGAAKTPKTQLFNPHQLPAHGRLCRRAPTLSNCMRGTHVPSRYETFSFRSGVLPDCRKSRHPIRAWQKMRKGTGGVYMHHCGWSVGHPTYMEEFCSCARPISGPRLK